MPETVLFRKRIPVWLDATVAEELQRILLPGTHPATMLRLLIRAALREVSETQLSEGVRHIASLAWAAVAPRRRRPAIIEVLPRLVDEHLEALGASYATRAKVYALLLPLSPLQRLALLVEGANQARQALGARTAPPPVTDEEDDTETLEVGDV
jgi:alkylhydroperoxidase/carboxymuconolactone decarboxylase family protein YurZ